MQRFIPFLKNTQLFNGIYEADILSVLDCLNAALKTYKKGEYIYHQGEHISNITILVEGKLHVQRDDYWGNSNIISHIDAGEMFSEAYATPDSETILNDVVAVEDSSVLFLDINKIITSCPSACRFHSTVIQNLFIIISDKNRKLVQKLDHMSKRSTREKLISYLSAESHRQNSPTFTIPFNRQQLADFLSVDRSAMSNELCKMRDDGLIKFERNRFTML